MIARAGVWSDIAAQGRKGILAAVFVLTAALPGPALSNASAMGLDDARIVSEFQGLREGAPFWLASDSFEKRGEALLRALEDATGHGMPPGRFDIAYLRSLLDDPARAREVETMFSLAFLDYARSVSSGLLSPRALDAGIHIDPLRPDPATLLIDATRAPSLSVMLDALAPSDPDYERLRAALNRLLEDAALGGWGITVQARLLRRGDRGREVAILRERLMRLGDLPPEPEMLLAVSDSDTVFDDRMEMAVKAFQRRHGLKDDGIAGPRTLAEINQPIARRIAQILINLERRRWRNRDLGRNRVMVNLAAFEMAMYNDDVPVFSSRVVVGQAEPRLNTPEFSDVMDHIVVNPTWFVPRSIATREILPKLREDPGYLAANAMTLVRDGEKIDPATVDWSTVSTEDFAFSIRQSPGPGNALGRVKFMFPNRFSVYLHDTPSRGLFNEESRAFSHGCVRVEQPIAFAQALLARQTPDTERYLGNLIEKGRERYVTLREPLPVHIIYETAWVERDGTLHFRPDVYGRDEVIAAALNNARS